MTQVIDVVIVAFESRKDIERCVRSALDLAGAGIVTVVDHGSDGSFDLARELGATAVVQENHGFGAGCNRGAREGRAPWVLFLNPDSLVNPEIVLRGLGAAMSRPDVGAVQGSIINEFSGGPERSQGREITCVHLLGRSILARRLLRFSTVRGLARRLPLLVDHVDRVPEWPSEVESLAATALLVRRTAFEAVEGFDESYFLYGEDLDLCRRLREHGWILLAVPGLWACHRGGGSSASEWRREAAWWQGTMHFAARWWGPWSWRFSLLAATIAWLRLTFRRPSQYRAAWRAVIGDAVAARRSRNSG